MAKKNKVPTRPNKESVGVEYRGVSLTNVRLQENEWKYKFRSRIGFQGERFYLGSFEDAKQAALAYNKEARRLFTQKQAVKMGRWNVI